MCQWAAADAGTLALPHGEEEDYEVAVSGVERDGL